MFGYISVNKQELKFREFNRYRSYYCGLCSELKQRYGKAAQFALSYDMTFLIMLLSALYEEESLEGNVRCLAHPFERHPVRINRFTEYAADMNLLLSYEKCADDWKDEKKLTRKLYSGVLKKNVGRIREKYPEKTAGITAGLEKIGRFEEAREANIDLPAGAFGEIMAEILAPFHDEWEPALRCTGFYLGKFVYIMDAYEDLEKDIKSGSYNPLFFRKESIKDGDLRELSDEVEAMLVMMMGECCRAFERLPIIDPDVEILRNILYSGVWCKYMAISREQGKKRQNKEDESI